MKEDNDLPPGRAVIRPGTLVVRDKVYTVSELTGVIKIALETAFPQVWVEGEVSNARKYGSGHLYLTLKDAGSSIPAVIWRGDASRLKFEVKDGQQLVCRGKIDVYPPRGAYQLIIDRAEPKGKGALQLAFEQLKEKLKAEGLFDPARKRKLPLRPKKIGVVTSPTGAAIVDILRTLERRSAKLHVLIYPAKVQGDGSADDIVAGIRAFAAMPDMDVLIVGRGGGSIEDLWSFNEEKVARAIAASPIPVISAVGHEVDFTIADFVADIRASTPTAAAEMVVETEEAFAERIANLERRAAQCLRFAVAGAPPRPDRPGPAPRLPGLPHALAGPGAARGRPGGPGLGGHPGPPAADRRRPRPDRPGPRAHGLRPAGPPAGRLVARRPDRAADHLVLPGPPRRLAGGLGAAGRRPQRAKPPGRSEKGLCPGLGPRRRGDGGGGTAPDHPHRRRPAGRSGHGVVPQGRVRGYGRIGRSR